MKYYRMISAALSAVMLLTLVSCQTEAESGPEDGSAAPAGVAVQAQEVTTDTIISSSSVSGRAVSGGSQRSVFVSSNLRCTAVFVEAGDEIQAGAPICTLDMSDTLSSLKTATTSYNNSQKSYRDQEALFDAQIALAQKSIGDTQKSYQDQEALFNSQIALAQKSISDTQKSYREQEELFDTQIALAEKNLRDLEALMAIGAASQAEIDQAKLSLQSLQTSKSSALAQLQSGIDSAQANVQSLQVSKSSTLTQLQSGIDSAQTNIQSLQVSKSSALAQLETGMQSTQLNIDQLRTVMANVDGNGNVLAPVAGKILSLNAMENGFVGPSAPVAVIDSAAQLEVAVSVSEALVPSLALGDEVDLSINALGTTALGTIQEIETVASQQTRLYDVTIALTEPVEGLRSGMFVDVSFRTDVAENAIVIPTEAILTSNDQQHVFVIEDGKARDVVVTVGLTGNGVTEILEGLQAGDQLVVVGQSYLTDGAPVRVVSGED